jgi:hypothetical protein
VNDHDALRDSDPRLCTVAAPSLRAHDRDPELGAANFNLQLGCIDEKSLVRP